MVRVARSCNILDGWLAISRTRNLFRGVVVIEIYKSISS